MKRSRIISFALAVVMWLSICLPNCLAFAAGPGSDGSEQLITLTINYCLEDSTKQVYESYVAQYPAASQTQYQVTSPKIDGYELVDQGQDTISGILTEDTEYTVEYRSIDPTYAYTVIYQGKIPSTGETIVLDQVNGTAPAGKIAIEPKEFAAFEKDYTGELSLEVTSDNQASMTVYYTLKSDPCVIFKTGGSYIAPIQEEVGASIGTQISAITAPTRQGYTFDKWIYKGKEYTTEELAEELSVMPAEQTIVEAKWAPGNANYMVKYWKENLTCDGYDLVATETETISATTGEQIVPTISMKAKDKDADGVGDCAFGELFYGFDYAKYDGSETVAADGSSVLNVYYDREIWTIKIYNISYRKESSELLDKDYLFKEVSGKYDTPVPENAFDIDFEKHYNSPETKELLYNNNTGTWNYGGTKDNARFVNFVYASMSYQLPLKFGIGYLTDTALEHGDPREVHMFPRYSDTPGQYDHYIYGETLDGTYELLEHKPEKYHTTNSVTSTTEQTPYGYTWYNGWFELKNTEQNFSGTLDYGESWWPQIPISSQLKYPRIPFKEDEQNSYQTGQLYIADTREQNKTNLKHLNPVDFYIYAKRIRSDVRFYDGGEELKDLTIEDQMFEQVVDVSNVEPPEKEGYQFEGWYTESELRNRVDSVAMADTDALLYAKWIPNSVTVTFNSQGGSAIQSQSVPAGSSAQDPGVPVWEGHTFLGWYTEPVGGELWSFERTVPEDRILYAHWFESNLVSFTVQHIMEGQTTPFHEITGRATIGDTLYTTALSAEDEGYPEGRYIEATSSDVQTLPIAADGSKNVITFWYSDCAKELTVRYLEKETERPLKKEKEVTTYNTVVTEFPAEISGYECKNENGYETQTMQEDGKNEIIFYYTPGEDAVGGLTVTKTVSGEEADKTEDFDFRITLEDTSINGEYGDVTFDDGVADFRLHHNQSVVVSGLPVGTGYEVEELQNDPAEETEVHEHDAECGYVEARTGSPCNHIHDENCGYVPTVEGSPCTHEHTDDCYIEQVNCVVVKNEQTSENLSEEELAQIPTPLPNFDDDHICTEESGCVVKVLNCQHIHDESCGYVEAAEGTPCNHVHDETCGFVFSVEAQPCMLEVNAREDAGYEVSSVYAEGVIGGDSIAVRFNNHKGEGTPPTLETGSLTVTNKITGNDADLSDRFDFVIELNNETINGWYGEVTFVDGVAQFSLGHLEEITAQDLPADISYTVSEVDSQDYTVTAQGENGEIIFDETVHAEFVNTRNKSGGGGAHHPEVDPDPKPKPEEPEDDPEDIVEEEVPLAETPWLNTDDHYAYIVGYPEDYVTGQPTEDESRWPIKPQANITRAEVATIFFRLLTDEARDQFWSTSNSFSDVAADAWYNNAVSTMVNAGIIQGYEDGTFRPNNNITRAEFAAIASRFMSSGYDVEEDLFTDIANHWARENINDAAMTKWINGYPDGTFLPDKAITRAEAVTLVNNVLQRKPDADHMLDSMIKWPDNPESAWYYEAIQEATNSHDYDLFEDAEYETWTALQENRDWAALEKDWVNAHRTGGEVM